MDDDFYDLLGVEPDVDHRTLRAAYLGRMRVHHPDRRPGDPGDVARRLNVAYEVLRDPARRAAYDRVRRARQAREAGDRAGGTPLGRVARDGGVRVVPRDRTVDGTAYSPANRSYYQAVSRRLLRIGGFVFAVGLILLVALSA